MVSSLPTDTMKVSELLRPIKERRDRARKRIDEEQQGDALFFAVLGTNADQETLHIGDCSSFRRVYDPPGEIELAGAMSNKQLLSSVARYSSAICLELRVNRERFPDPERASTYAWWVITALRIRTSSGILVPLVANCSWSCIAGVPENSCEISLIEDVPLAHRFGEARSIGQSDAKWIEVHIGSLRDLLEDAKFRMAVDSATEYHLQRSLRMSVAHLWAGIEALLSISSELRFRISAYIAAFVAAPGPQRLRVFKRVRMLYDFRSKAVHGALLDDDELRRHASEVNVLLSEILIKCIETGKVPSSEDWDRMLLCSD